MTNRLIVTSRGLAELATHMVRAESSVSNLGQSYYELIIIAVRA